MSSLAKVLILTGFFIMIFGIGIYISSKIGLPFGKIPGDIEIKKERYSIYIPLASTILISIFLTLLLNFLFWIFRK
jgi:hypothetical protein